MKYVRGLKIQGVSQPLGDTWLVQCRSIMCVVRNIKYEEQERRSV
jgi:hypothetical protein